MYGGQLVEQREDGYTVHHSGFEQEPLAARGSQVAQLAVGMNDGAFVGGDGVGSVLECSADMVDGGLAGFDVERSRFEQNISAGGGQPFASVAGVWGGHSCPPTAG